MPSSLSLASMAKMKKSVAYCRYTMRAPGSNHLDASRKLHTPSGRVLSVWKSSFTMICCCCSGCRGRRARTMGQCAGVSAVRTQWAPRTMCFW
jgi:hypothetical protein